MKTLFVAFLGLLLGATAALALLYYNPLTATPDVDVASASARTLQYELPAHALSFSQGERALPPGVGAGGDDLWEETISGAALLALSLDNPEGAPAAAASRLLQASPDTNLLLTGVVLNDFWLLTVPGEGSLFLRADSNLWPFLKSTFIPTWYFGRSWQGPADYRPTVGPGPASAVVIGATGRYANLAGYASEQYRLTALDRERRTVAFASELHLDFADAAVPADDTEPSADGAQPTAADAQPSAADAEPPAADPSAPAAEG